ncbi:hypothetical protein BD413DRAFT_606783 [Trametes elegans]|nr:hypothetical protein BD413DRAFT_606783 [Trametes elegans]
MSASPASAATTRRAVSGVLSESFAPFDRRAKLAIPFDEESKRDAEFAEKLNAMLLELVLEFHAWSAARPVYQSNRVADKLEEDMKSMKKTEEEQGRSTFPFAQSTTAPSRSLVENTRQRLNEFITRIKLALAALTGLAS